jgi:hypothetical protein
MSHNPPGCPKIPPKRSETSKKLLKTTPKGHTNPHQTINLAPNLYALRVMVETIRNLGITSKGWKKSK